MLGELPSGRTIGSPIGLLAGATVVPVSPVTPFMVRLTDEPGSIITALAPVGGDSAVNALPVRLTTSRFGSRLPGVKRIGSGLQASSTPSSPITSAISLRLVSKLKTLPPWLPAPVFRAVLEE